ncbi:pterin-4-alpha-carbinolamine dehydratase 2 isoform X1 [Pelodiscus sinensis]|uniref:pterin-4-alpha-carbinolamine dehydratase 2 isoform X1 n=1 Tax=Pelodiscus sinensis TaxID=13735 RepID=UPI003F6D9F74
MTFAEELDPEPSFEPLAQAAALLPLPLKLFMERRVWRLDTSSDWCDWLVMQQWDDDQWLRNFRMQKTTFQELCAWLTPALQHQDTHLRPAIPLEKRVAIVLWKLATLDRYRSMGHGKVYRRGRLDGGGDGHQFRAAPQDCLPQRPAYHLGQICGAGFSETEVEHSTGLTSRSVHCPIEQHSTLIERATFQ